MRKLRYKFQIDAKTLLQNPFKNLTISDWIRVGYRFFEEVIEAVGIQEGSNAYNFIMYKDDITDEDILKCVDIKEDTLEFDGVDDDKIGYSVDVLIDETKIFKLCDEHHI